jgi:hypothetical protein
VLCQLGLDEFHTFIAAFGIGLSRCILWNSLAWFLGGLAAMYRVLGKRGVPPGTGSHLLGGVLPAFGTKVSLRVVGRLVCDRKEKDRHEEQEH